MFRCSASTLLALAAAFPAAADYPNYAGERYTQGRSVWLDTCEGCHGYGIAGSPDVNKVEQWLPRVKQGGPVLYEHATEGFFGPKGTMMPPRGGNDSLTDDQVEAAVDYMVRLATGIDLSQHSED